MTTPEIRHTQPGVGGGQGARPAGAAEPGAGESGAAPAAAAPKIRAFAQALGGANHQEDWKRPTNVTGTGATHVRSFHCKLTGESLEFLDRQVNEWLDAHPECEVKFVSTTVGEWTGKIKEPNLVVQVWV